MWNAAGTIYTATYNVTDANVDVNAVTVGVSGAQDAAGNAQQTYTAATEFEIDTVNPTVTDVTASDLVITDVDAGTGTLSIAVTFSEAMDKLVAPTLTLSPDVSGSVAFGSGVWNAAGTIYTATYNVTDANVDVNAVTVGVSGAQDAAGNAQQTYTAATEFEIDTVNPTVTDVTASDLVITDVDAGTGTLSIAVTFSEAISKLVAPTLTLSPDVSGSVAFGSGVWNAAGTIYTATYNVTDANVDVNAVTVGVSGAQDAAGNAQQTYTAGDRVRDRHRQSDRDGRDRQRPGDHRRGCGHRHAV